MIGYNSVSKRYDLLDYKFAKEVSADFPLILDLIDKMIVELQPYTKYVTVRALLEDLYLKSQQLQTNIKYSKDVVINKGSRDGR